ncbi:glucose-6-phosphate isomerase [Campylobacter sp. LH-2024]|uniref:Glucose-6-phosphate isomerase n=1 Tax=Campylobacter molothri TaxID=1032242 RepID=A0ACC5W3L7_9BACT|nr:MULTISPECIES: glucose-6-phosphate isomerase [unclassified Campylobacter]MBZ7929138.1 glucose-6-phosphate isomerase [Campylobacter sp. RM10542]MBZ7930578.1 glucose-6-phosphate isomerase [Campylobacter sp. W0067]MBZ7932058.1 glucose-6-phosphate isomerase [Campylobacter sp. RM12910]MBZ7938093.1 glucose-6-phosphate isomerase [Campylobacter sp. RM10538]MBZ7941291.1 glucose-6-phosphate isomerase [Campylobacter sp. W0047]MBZ7945842.1 glucose-6-phosphate isomerase [Campylobacter sp. RM10532]MBZ79
MKSLTHLNSYKELHNHFLNIKDVHMRDLFREDQNRGMRYFLETDYLKLDYSKNRINDETLKLLFNLANECSLKEKMIAMFKGEKINTTENRAVLHTALRNKSNHSIMIDDMDIMPNVREVLTKMQNFSDSLRSGAWLGYTNQVITDIVNIGIGGSDLGALMVCEALKNFGHPRLHMHFVSNVDGAQLQGVLDQVHPETTLFIVASKTFSTQETLTNAFTARKWFLNHALDEKYIAKHFVAVSTNKEAVKEFGIDSNNMFEFWNWVGGRYSLWSAIGLSIMIYLGKENFSSLLEGAYIMDEHFYNQPFEKNMPVILGLIGVWYINFFDAGSHIIAPYDSVLKYLPKFIQQLDMESNGKQVRKDGKKVDYDTGPIIWGDTGINAQHAFFQLLHQGTHLSPIDLIASLSKKGSLPGHHEILLSNVFAQAEAFMKGKTLEEVQKEMSSKGFSEEQIHKLAPHRVFSGNRPSNIILLNEINPKSIGSLVALYEHKIFVQGVIWGINSFDQWGVELGKELVKTILSELQGGKIQEHDSSTKHLIQIYKNFNSI